MLPLPIARAGKLVSGPVGATGVASSFRGVVPQPVQIPIWLDLLAVVPSALAGALVAARARFDLTGVFGVGLLAGIGGGLLRDVLLNQLPVAFKSPWYIATALACALVIALTARRIERYLWLVVFLDAAALGLYGVTGVNKGLINGLAVLPAVVLGLVAATGGSVLRDLTLSRQPEIFQRGQLYATAALAGVLTYAALFKLGVDETATALIAAAVTFTVRIAAWRLDIRLPGAVDVPGAIADRVGDPGGKEKG